MNGLLLLNKSLGMSSNRAMQQVKRLLNLNKIGHTGSLDPEASGMLPLCIGEATKFAQYLLDADKIYEVSGRLGICTTTGDIEGEVVSERLVPALSRDDLKQQISKFQGIVSQTPPMYSALKYQGQPLYRYALQGIEIERPAREVCIKSIQLLDFVDDVFSVRVACSKGTYMRTLIQDIGEALSCGAHVVQLHRSSTAGFPSEKMIRFEELEALSPSDRESCILPMDVMVQNFPSMILSNEAAERIQNGLKLFDLVHEEGVYRLYNENHDFIGLGEYISNNVLVAKRMCRPLNK